MRPDNLEACGHTFLKDLAAHNFHTPSAKTVMPFVTFPCHMSLFHSVTPERHGVLTNTYVPQVRPVKGLCEVLRAAGKTNAFFYNWEKLKDLCRSDSLALANCISGHIYSYAKANEKLTDNAIAYIIADAPDFTFLYLGYADEAGHAYGWMSEKYLESVRRSFDCIEKLINSISDDYCVIVTADHGSHGHSHGTDMPEDMTIPLFFYNREISGGNLDGAEIINIAPTIAGLLGVKCDVGRSAKSFRGSQICIKVNMKGLYN